MQILCFVNPMHLFMPPFCSGCPGSINSTRMPNLTHQALKRVKPKAPVEPNGDPLSDRMTKGIPYCRKIPAKAKPVASTFCCGIKQKAKM